MPRVACVCVSPGNWAAVDEAFIELPMVQGMGKMVFTVLLVVRGVEWGRVRGRCWLVLGRVSRTERAMGSLGSFGAP